MPTQIQFDHNLRILLVVYEGNIRGWDVSEVWNKIAPHFDELNSSAVIVDFMAITSFDVAGEIVRFQAKRDVAMIGEKNLPIALVIPRKPHLLGLARMYELSVGFQRLDIFYSREEAFASLKIVAPKFEPLILPKREFEPTGSEVNE